MILVTLYTKPGCHLCEAVEQVIGAVKARRPFELRLVDINQDSVLFEQYKHAIPVVVVNGREIARYRLDRATFEKALDAEVSASGGGS